MRTLKNKRSWIAQSAHRPGAGIHQNKKIKRKKNKSEMIKKIIKEQMNAF